MILASVSHAGYVQSPRFLSRKGAAMLSPIGFREFSEDEYRKFIQTLSDEELIKAGKRLRSLCGDVAKFFTSG